MKTFVSQSVDETIQFGAGIGEALGPGDVVALVGELASGKTVLTKGIAAGLGVPEPEKVNSPTFIIVKEYKGRLPLYHFDMYRLEGPRGLETIDYKEYFFGDGVSVIEWADRIEEILPPEHMCIEMRVSGENSRRISVTSRGKKYKALVEKIAADDYNHTGL